MNHTMSRLGPSLRAVDHHHCAGHPIVDLGRVPLHHSYSKRRPAQLGVLDPPTLISSVTSVSVPMVSERAENICRQSWLETVQKPPHVSCELTQDLFLRAAIWSSNVKRGLYFGGTSESSTIPPELQRLQRWWPSTVQHICGKRQCGLDFEQGKARICGVALTSSPAWVLWHWEHQIGTLVGVMGRHSVLPGSKRWE